jgi:hypothetical protein
VAGGAALALASAPSGTLYGCVSGGASSDDPNPAGTLSIVDTAASKCPLGDSAITFNQPPALPVAAIAGGHKKLTLHLHKPITVFHTKIVARKGYRMWTQASLDVKTGAHHATITVRMLLNGKPDGPAVTTTVPAHSSQDITPLFLCNEMPLGSNVVGIRVLSSASGVTIGTRTLVSQAVSD